jgi:4-amino-4-deoxy-L-arabinose transferase-like glycosyltransferase
MIVDSSPQVAPKRFEVATGLLAGLGLVNLVAHLLVAQNYGYFRDELYYVAAGRHLALGYVDFPPMIAIVAALVRLTLGESLFALHVVPAIVGAVLVVLTGLMARELGGGRFAQGLAALGSLVAAGFLGAGSIFSMDALDQLWWVLAAYVVVRLIGEKQPRLWLVFGLVAGLGLLTKVTMLFFGFGLFVGLLLTPRRAELRSRWIWLGGALAFAFLLPYLFWNAAHGFPTLAFWANYGGKLAGGSAISFLGQQVLTMNPLTLPLWLTGLFFYFFTKVGKPYRALGWTFVTLYLFFTLTQAKAYFLSPAYPMLFAGGAVSIERHVATWLKLAYAVMLAASVLFVAPLAMPILPPATYGQMYGFMGADAGVQMERHETSVLPQWLADRFGWEGMVATIARVYNRLPLDERAKACIFTGNYGEAGAVDFFGPAYHLPAAISGHNTYFLWGPGSCTGEVVISVGISRPDLETIFGDVQQADTVTCQNCMPFEDNLPIFVSRQPKVSIREIWPRVKHYD